MLATIGSRLTGRALPRGIPLVASSAHTACRAPLVASATRAACTVPPAADVDIDKVAYGFMASQALFAGLENGVFDAISAAGDGGFTLAALQTECGISAPRLQTLLTSLTAINSLARDGASGAYTLSPNTARFLVQSSPAYYGDYLRYQVGGQFYARMGHLPDVMRGGTAPSYSEWFADPATAATYTRAQHNGSTATARYLIKKKLDLGGVAQMLDVGGGSGAFSYVFAAKEPGLVSTILELPEVCKTGEAIRADQLADVQKRVRFQEHDASDPDWPCPEAHYDIVLMSYVSGSVPEPVIADIYRNAHKALKPGGRLLVHDFMVDDALDGPELGALWALQHVCVNAEGLGLTPRGVIGRMGAAGFAEERCETSEMIGGMTKLVVAHKAP